VHRARRPRTTSREREILQRLSDGETGEQIATAMHLSPETVRTHLRNTMRKLEASTRVQAVAIALRDGEIAAA
jgi:DNA-binding NarL/FixJ family response regulator